eukprot:TRINITY_DN5179_c0_g1_i2.p1 TRINITY_DN5179_c0_g1~~TRINITY_DN5179_c0_g1_i2.p1  ORF type:complete len:516 (+),score=103.47 TRINITY_DN5179_c0_g1_i2:60-1607(+)
MHSYGDPLAKRRRTAQPCQRFMAGACVLGDSCQDLHYRPLCKSFEMGGCTKGDDCPDSHGTQIPFDFASAAAFKAAAALDSSAAASSVSQRDWDWQASNSTGPAFDFSSAATNPATDWSSAGFGGDGSSSASSMLAAAQGGIPPLPGLGGVPPRVKPVGRQDASRFAGAASQDDSEWSSDWNSDPASAFWAALSAVGGNGSSKGGWASALAAAGAPSWGMGSSKGGKQKGKKGGAEGKGKKGGADGKKGDGKKGPPMTKDGDWACTSCKNVNFQWRDTCNFCGAEKPEEEKRKAEKKNATNDKGANRAARDWACPDCNKPNFAWRTECFSCNTDRPPMELVDPNAPNDKAVGFKFTLCRFNLVNKCERGALCTYAHTREELADAKATVKTSLCKYFAVGQCGRGALCTFAHGNEDLVHRHGKEQDTAKEAWYNAHLQLAISGLKDYPAEQARLRQQAAAPSLSSFPALELPPMPELPPMDPEQILQGMELQQNAAQALPFGAFPSFDFSAFAEGY